MTHFPANDASQEGIDLSAIEQQKENIQPLATGRSAKALHNIFTSDRKVLQDELKEGHDRFQVEIEQAEAEGADDPLDVYHRYVRWTLSSYPSGPSHASHLVPLLERSTRRFVHEEQYRSDIRLLKLWLLYAKYVDRPKDIFRFLEGLQCGTKLAGFYEEWALLEEQSNNFPAADSIYSLGIARRAQPLERLKKRRDAFQARMLLPRPAAQVEEEASSNLRTSSSQRSILGTSSSGSATIAGPTFRGTAASHVSTKAALPKNGASAFAVFKDGGDTQVTDTTASQSEWTDFGTNAVRRRENERAAVPWKGETLPVYKDGEDSSRPVSLSSSMKFEVFRDQDAESPAVDLGASQPREALSLARSLRGPGEAELLRQDPFRHYQSGAIILADLPDPATIPSTKEPKSNTSSNASATSSATRNSSRPGQVRASISQLNSKARNDSASTSLAPGEKRKERVASPLHDIYPEGAQGPEYSFEELLAAKRQLRVLRTGQVGPKTALQDEPWQEEARQLGTYWTCDTRGEVQLRDPASGEALFKYLKMQDLREQALELARQREAQEQREREAQRQQEALAILEQEKRRQEEEERARLEDEAKQRAAEIERQAQEERKCEQERMAVIAQEEAQRARLALESAEADRDAQLSYSSEERSVSPPTSNPYHRPPSPTINTKAALAEVNAMFGRTMRFDGEQEDEYDSSATEHSSSDEDERPDVYDNEAPLPPSQAETDGSFWSMAQTQSQSQQPFSQFSTQQSGPADSQSSSLGFGSASEAGDTSDQSDTENGPAVYAGKSSPIQEQLFHPLSRSSSSSSSSGCSSQDQLAADRLVTKGSPPVFMAFTDGSENDENAAHSAQNYRSAFKPSRTPLGMKITPSAASEGPAFTVFHEHSASQAEPSSMPDSQEDAGIEGMGYDKGRRAAGNNRFAVMMDIMTPITERTCEFGMQTATMSSRRTGEIHARMLTDTHLEAEDLFDQAIPEDLASSRGSNWDAGKKLQQIDEEGDHSSQIDNIQESSSPSQNITRSAAIDSAPSSCDPLSPEQISDILDTSSTPLTSIEGFRDHRNQTSSKLGVLQRTAQSRRKSSHNASHSRASVAHEETAWQLELDQDVFSVREKLGEGGFGSVFRVAELLDDVAEDDDEDSMKQTALKIESPPNLWEFYIIALLHNRLPERTRGSVVQAYRLYAFQDESHLLLDYCDQGSLLDAVNHAHDAGIGPAGTVSTGLEEVLAIFFTIELTRVLECFHTYRFIHGDFKIDNCLIRLDDVPGSAARNWSNAYKADGTGGWKHKGVTIIDFGRTVDLDHFEPGQTFTTEVKTDKHDCPEVAEGRPWLYQPDYYGLACIAHVLLFGKYLETVQTGEDSRTGLPKHSIKEPLKRYHQASLWNRFFDLLLNPTSFTEGDPSKPITHLLKDTRHDMERWLEANSDKNGKSLKGLLKKLEIWALSRQ